MYAGCVIAVTLFLLIIPDNGYAGYDNYVTVNGTPGDDNQATFGTPLRDKIVQNGFDGNDSLYISGDTSDDRLEQNGGDGDDQQDIDGGTVNDRILQDGGEGNDNQGIFGGGGGDRIEQYGGRGDDSLHMDAGSGDGTDIVGMYAGDGADTMTYELSAGNDRAFIDGGRGEDRVTINANNQNFTVYRAYIKKGKVFYKRIYRQGIGGSRINVKDVEHGTHYWPMMAIRWLGGKETQPAAVVS